MARFQRKEVWRRATGRCEYCQLPQEHSILPHQVDHIRAKKHHGPHTMENTCLACGHCNAAKGSNAAGYDFETDDLVPLFNPRAHSWHEHFEWQGAWLVGKTPIGRATIDVLDINDPICVDQRLFLLNLGQFPPNS